MRWQTSRQSQNVDDRRGMRLAKGGIVGGGIGAVVLAVIVMLLGGNPEDILTNPSLTAPQGQVESRQTSPHEEEQARFASAVLAETEDAWNQVFSQAGRQYQEPVLVLYSGGAESACGFAQSAVGPFYCPADHKVYLDLGFFDDLSSRFGAAGDFAAAYVIAHEVGHHVQNILGILPKVHEMRQQSDQATSNQLSVRLELHADCLAGIWAHHVAKYKGILEQGDIEEAIAATKAVGDDRIQMQGQGYVVPDTFTHGTSAQRTEWFLKGFRTGQTSVCDTCLTDRSI